MLQRVSATEATSQQPRWRQLAPRGSGGSGSTQQWQQRPTGGTTHHISRRPIVHLCQRGKERAGAAQSGHTLLLGDSNLAQHGKQRRACHHLQRTARSARQDDTARTRAAAAQARCHGNLRHVGGRCDVLICVLQQDLSASLFPQADWPAATAPRLTRVPQRPILALLLGGAPGGAPSAAAHALHKIAGHGCRLKMARACGATARGTSLSAACSSGSCRRRRWWGSTRCGHAGPGSHARRRASPL